MKLMKTTVKTLDASERPVLAEPCSVSACGR